MSKRKQRQKPEISKQTDYKLHTKAVDDLAEADESNSPEVSEEELRKYRSGPKLKIPEYGKLLFVKFWFAAATCFFFIWGLAAIWRICWTCCLSPAWRSALSPTC